MVLRKKRAKIYFVAIIVFILLLFAVRSWISNAEISNAQKTETLAIEDSGGKKIELAYIDDNSGENLDVTWTCHVQVKQSLANFPSRTIIQCIEKKPKTKKNLKDRAFLIPSFLLSNEARGISRLDDIKMVNTILSRKRNETNII